MSYLTVGRPVEQCRQNHPELVVRGVVANTLGIGARRLRAALKRHGVNKWFAVRRMLIQLKHRWKQQLTDCYMFLNQYRLQLRQHAALGTRDYRAVRKLQQERYWMRGYTRALEETYMQVRALCNMPRDIDLPENSAQWPATCDLPDDFPARPKRNYFRRAQCSSTEKS